MKLGIQDNLLAADSLVKKFALAEKYGFQGIEICYVEGNFERLKEFKDAFSTSQINLAAISGFAGDLLTEKQDIKNKTIENYDERMKFCNELGGVGVISVPTFGQGVYSSPHFSVVYPCWW